MSMSGIAKSGGGGVSLPYYADSDVVEFAKDSKKLAEQAVDMMGRFEKVWEAKLASGGSGEVFQAEGHVLYMAVAFPSSTHLLTASLFISFQEAGKAFWGRVIGTSGEMRFSWSPMDKINVTWTATQLSESAGVSIYRLGALGG